MKINLLLAFVLALPFTMNAQSHEAGVVLGPSVYQGDLATVGSAFSEMNFSAGLFHRYHFDNKLALRSFVNFGGLSGDDANFRDDGIYNFEGGFFDLGTGVEYTINGADRINSSGDLNKAFSVSVFAGVGLVSFSPENNLAATAPENTMDYSNAAFMIPIGLGWKYNLTKDLTLGGDFIMKGVFSDYVDGVSESANPEQNDAYIQAVISVGYMLSK